MPELRMIPYEQINEPPFPMREQFGDTPFQELVESIGSNGVQNPLKVRPVDGRFDVIAGHRRYKAAGVCALRELPCIVEECDELTAVALMVAENTGREDVTPTEEGRFYLGLIERFKLSMPDLARLVRKSEAYCDARIDLVRLDEDIAEAVLQKQITFSVANELLRVNPYTAALALRTTPDKLDEKQTEGIHRHRKFLLDLCIRCGATQRVARSYVEQWKTSLIPLNPLIEQQEPGVIQQSTVIQRDRCICCGRDADPQNMRPLMIHFWEMDKVLQVLREAGIPVYV